MNWLITSDIHLTDTVRDSYRFGLFKWMVKQQKKHDVHATFILGDITDKKDKHSSTLVNRTVDELRKLKPPVYIVRGNHDGVNPDDPFFRFLGAIDGIHFITHPVFDQKTGVAFIPHCRDQAALDAAAAKMPAKPQMVMLHQTFEGAKSEVRNAPRLSGLSASPIEALKALVGVYSGDVHKPQRQGCVTYVGSPYHVRFGDNFTPRVLLLKGGVEQNLYFDCPHKWALTVRDPDEILNDEQLRAGDQAKITIELAREEAVEYQTHKRRILDACKSVGLEIYGVDLKVNTTKPVKRAKQEAVSIRSPKDIMEAFCSAEGVASNIKQTGMEYLK